MFAPMSFIRRALGWRLLSPDAGQVAAVTAMSILLGACAQTPPRAAGADPADPRAHVGAATYRPVLGSYVSGRPAAPSGEPGAAPGPNP